MAADVLATQGARASATNLADICHAFFLVAVIVFWLKFHQIASPGHNELAIKLWSLGHVDKILKV